MSLPSLLSAKTKIKPEQVRQFNLVAAGLLAVQAIALLVLAKTVTYPVSVNFLTPDSLAPAGSPLVAATQNVFDLNLAWLVAAALLIAAVTHLMLATVCREWYEKNLKKSLNPARWLGCGVAAGLT